MARLIDRYKELKDTGIDPGSAYSDKIQTTPSAAELAKAIASLQTGGGGGYYAKYTPGEWDLKADELGKLALGMNYQDWTQGDAYKSLVDRYTQSGNRAMLDTLGTLAARTGGLASSYAGAAAQNSYNDYMRALEDTAYNMFRTDRSNAFEDAALARTYADRDYQRWADDFSRRKAAASSGSSKINTSALEALLKQYLPGNTGTFSTESLKKSVQEDPDQYDYGVWKTGNGYEFMGRTYDSEEAAGDAIAYAHANGIISDDTFDNAIGSMVMNGLMTEDEYKEITGHPYDWKRGRQSSSGKGTSNSYVNSEK